MKFYGFLISLAASATAILWPGATVWKNNQPSFTKVCLYSNDPSKFTPMCILCPNTLYPIVLTTCVMGSVIPMNVTYTQASCIVGNCATLKVQHRAVHRKDRLIEVKSNMIESLPLRFVDSRPVSWNYRELAAVENEWLIHVTGG
uniref:Uncharacterized protein n=3 Tax=Araneus ventricosus TaxID=182803 RepID=A0A4Y2VP10_ARAVE|nr:hypothetical protein AVEN_124374-1 [Araneus ventricosus]